MSDTLALEQLYTLSTTRLVGDGTLTAPAITFGWREPPRRGLESRIVWKPGDPTEKLGEIGSAVKPGRVPARPLATLRELWTCWITGVNTSDKSDLAQYKACRLLFDAWYRSVYRASFGRFRIVAADWERERKEGAFGATIRVVGAIEAMIPDSQVATAPADTHAEIGVQLDPYASPPELVIAPEQP